MSRAPRDWDALSGRIVGNVLRPEAPGYESARRPEMSRFHAVAPAAIVRAATPADVAEALAFADRHDLPVAVRSGGHCFAGRSSTEGLLVDVSPMDSVSLSDDSVTVGAGTRLDALYRKLAADGRTIPGGCGPTVGIAGLTLGGGLGILGRTYGLTCDSLTRASVVLADGREVQAHAHAEPDLFWALRGAGGGQFGVVTSLEFRTVPSPVCTAFDLVWDFHHAAEIIDAWQSWAPDAPDALVAGLLVNAPSDPGAVPRVTAFGAMLGARPDADLLLDELVSRVAATPRSDWRAEQDWLATKRVLVERAPGDGDGDEGDMYQRSEFFRRAIPREAITEVLAQLNAGRVPGTARELDFSPWGGAYNRTRGDATAFAHRSERFLLKHATVIRDGAPAGARADAVQWLERSWRTTRPFGSGGVYANFPDPELDDPGRAYHGPNLERLRRVKARYDPSGFFRFAQSISGR